MTACDLVTLSQYLDGGLSLPDRIELERHLLVCRACEVELAELRRIDVVLAAWGSQRLPVSRLAEDRITRSVERRGRVPALLAKSQTWPTACGGNCDASGWLAQARRSRARG